VFWWPWLLIAEYEVRQRTHKITFNSLKKTQGVRRKMYWAQNVYLIYPYNICSKHFSSRHIFSDMRAEKHACLHAKSSLKMSDLNGSTILHKIFFHKNRSVVLEFRHRHDQTLHALTSCSSCLIYMGFISLEEKVSFEVLELSCALSCVSFLESRS
jgi:hypothetical protein